MKITDKLTITNECNLQMMARYPDQYFDLAIVDPPYGASDAIETNKSNSKNKATKRKEYTQFENVAPPDNYWKELKRISKHQIVWGGNFFGLVGGVIAWNKNGTAFGEGEIAICTTHNSVRFFEYTWNGMIQADMKNKELRIHPTQKPVALYKYILDKYSNPGDKIVDTHLGSGSIAIACHDYGFDLTACELDHVIYQNAIQRIKDHVSQLKMEL